MGNLSNRARELLLAVSFLTRLPVAAYVGNSGLAGAAWAFPLVGAGLGFVGGLVFLLSTGLGLPSLAAALLTLGALVLATGALHEDGLADAADGLGGGRDRSHKLSIMRDSYIGTYGSLALIFFIGLKVVALAAIGDDEPLAVMKAMIATGTMSRAFMAVLMTQLPPARADGLRADAGRSRPSTGATAIILALLVTGVLFVGNGWLPIVAAITAGALATGVIATLAWCQLSGTTGDVLGASQQVSETAMLLALATMTTGATP
jgi:adenosylcobinamide-GDP ribazoletransferase